MFGLSDRDSLEKRYVYPLCNHVFDAFQTRRHCGNIRFKSSSSGLVGFLGVGPPMASLPQSSENFPEWSSKAKEMAAEAQVLSGNKLEQLVVRIQRHTGRPKDTCWRFVIQYGIKRKPDYRRWTDPEFDLL